MNLRFNFFKKLSQISLICIQILKTVFEKHLSKLLSFQKEMYFYQSLTLKMTFSRYNINVLTLKTDKLKYFSAAILLILLIACSTKKDKWVNRNFQALNTKYNVLYHGNVALDKGMIDLKTQYKDNFWQILPIERLTVSKENLLPGETTKNANFQRAEEKATKAIQKRSMNIDGKEKNAQIDEAYLLLGKSRYYDQRFIPALEAFNYILYKYPESDKIYIAKIWREKTNMRLENDALAINNLRKLLKEIKFKDQVFADANATLSQAFLNMEEKDSAISHLRKAIEFTKFDEEKARYHFILGQLYEEAGSKPEAFTEYQSVIDMKRKSSRIYIIHAHARQAQQFDFEKGDTVAFIKKYKELLKDRENRPFLDMLNHQMALFYDKKNNDKQAKYYYNKSLRTKSQDQYLMASNYRNLAKRYFDNAKYQTAGQYYDSTLVKLTPRTREYISIKKKRDNLADVIKYEAIAQRNDSILNVMSLSENDRKGFYNDYIIKLKKSDEAKAKLEKIKQENAARLANAQTNIGSDPRDSQSGNPSQKFDQSSKTGIAPPVFGPKATGAEGTFYFYNQATLAYGRIEFKKKWGNRALKDNWRSVSEQTKSSDNPEDKDSKDGDIVDGKDGKSKDKAVDPRYTSDFYLKQLPTTQKAIDSLAKDRNFAYYQLGVIYKEKFKEYKLAANKLEQLLKNNPEERLILPSMYHLYKIYEIIDKDKALAMKDKIIAQYPDSRYAQILGNTSASEASLSQSPDVIYTNLYKLYENGKYYQVLDQSTKAVDQFTGEEIVPKLELLKANTVGKLKGLAEYKTALNYVALNYPNVDEGKDAEGILAKNVPAMEKLKFYSAKPESWKIIYKVANADSLKTKALVQKIKKFTSERTSEKLKYSEDIYNMTESFIVIHGMKSEESAKGIVSVLKDYKDYKIAETGIVISNENYKIVQIKKNLEEYLVTPKTDPILEPVTPEPVMPSPPKPGTKDQRIPPAKKQTQNAARELSPVNVEERGIKIDDSDDPEPEKAMQSTNPRKGKEETPPKKP